MRRAATRTQRNAPAARSSAPGTSTTYTQLFSGSLGRASKDLRTSLTASAGRREASLMPSRRATAASSAGVTEKSSLLLSPAGSLTPYSRHTDSSGPLLPPPLLLPPAPLLRLGIPCGRRRGPVAELGFWQLGAAGRRSFAVGTDAWTSFGWLDGRATKAVRSTMVLGTCMAPDGCRASNSL